jgi:hypothetical protein
MNEPNYGIVFYDIECEQLEAGLPVLICFAFWTTDHGFVDVPYVNKYVGDLFPVYYVYGRECLTEFLTVMADVRAWTKKRENYLLGYNNQAFDDFYLIEKIQNTRKSCKPRIKELRFHNNKVHTLIWQCKHKTTLQSKDVIRFMAGNQSLQVLGETLKLPKLKDDFDFKSYSFSNALQALKYCVRDI